MATEGGMRAAILLLAILLAVGALWVVEYKKSFG